MALYFSSNSLNFTTPNALINSSLNLQNFSSYNFSTLTRISSDPIYLDNILCSINLRVITFSFKLLLTLAPIYFHNTTTYTPLNLHHLNPLKTYKIPLNFHLVTVTLKLFLLSYKACKTVILTFIRSIFSYEITSLLIRVYVAMLRDKKAYTVGINK